MKKNRIKTALAVSSCLASISCLSGDDRRGVANSPEPVKPQASPTATVQSQDDDLKIAERRVSGVVVLDLAGKFKAAESNVLLRKTISDLLLKRERNIVLNLAGVTSIDETGIKGLASNFQLVSRAKGQLKLLNPTTDIRNLLASTKLATPFGIYDDESSAINSFNLATTTQSKIKNCGTRKELEQSVSKIIVDELGVSENEVTPKARIIDDLGADSLDVVELVMRFEEVFDIEIPDSDYAQLRQVSGIHDYLWRRVCQPH